MTDTQIMSNAIVKAHTNRPFNAGGWKSSHLIQLIPHYEIDLLIKPFLLIYNHDFAKALWGEELGYVCISSIPCDCDGWHKADESKGNYGWYPKWIFHLERMVKEEQPLQYLKRTL